MNPPVSSLVGLRARIFRLLPPLLVAMALAAPFISRAEGVPKNWCVLVEDESTTSSAESAKREGESGGGDEIAPKPKTKRPPYAEEVGPPPDTKLDHITPLPGLPVDTSFDNVFWIRQGPGLTMGGDLNIAPSHPTSGCVTAVVPHPTDQNTIYIGTANGGVWKTTNALSALVRWKPLTDDQLSLSIGGLAMDRSDATGNTLVAGFGRRSSFFGYGGAHKGLIRTTDGGTTWTRIGETALAERSIYQMSVSGNVWLLAVPSGTSPGLYRTTNGGTSFVNISGGSGLPAGAVTHLAAHPSNFAIQYVHVRNTGVYRSTDSGATWTDISANMPAANFSQVALTVAFDGTLFAAALSSVPGDPDFVSRVYRSTNQGDNWTPMDTVKANASGLFNGFVADPSNSNLVYLSGLFTRCCFPFSGRVVRGDASAPVNTQWTPIASTQLQPGSGPCPTPSPPAVPCLGTANGGTAPHTDSRAMAFTAGNRLIEGDDGGIYVLNVANVGSEGDGAGGGGTWSSLNGDLRITEMHDMAYDSLSRIVIGGAQDTGFQEQTLPGQPLLPGTPGWKATSTGDGGDAAVDFLNPPGKSVRYGSSQYLGGFYRDTYDADGTLSLHESPNLWLPGNVQPNDLPFVAPIAVNALVGARLIISGNTNIYESTDGGSTLSSIGAFPANQYTKIAYGGKFGGAPAPGILFYGQGSNICFRTAASGNVTGVVGFPGGAVQGLVFDPGNWKTAFVIGTTAGPGSSSVYSANDIPANLGNAFTDITGNLTGVGTFHTIDYLTLPDGNAIVVGTDLGAYIMRIASPGVWKTLGDNLPHAPVYDSQFDAAGQVLVVTTLGRGAWLYDCKHTKTTGQYGETFQAYGPTITLAPAAGELYSTNPVTVAGVMDNDLRELRLTADGTGNTRTAFRLPDLNPGRAVPAFSAKWNASIYGDSSQLADGFSFNFGPLGGVPSIDFLNGTYNNEDGFNAGLTVSVRTFSGSSPGYYVRVNGSVVAGGFVSKPSANWGNFNVTRHFFEVDWRMDTGLTLRVDGVAIFTNLATPGFLPAVGDRFVFGARTGGLDEETSLDNIAIFTGGVMQKIPATMPYYAGGSELPENAFDGSPDTKWSRFTYTGFIGASFSSAKTVRLYTLISAGDAPGSDLAAWDFQTGNDGLLWTQHGAQGEQFFKTRLEQRAFVVADPVAASKFRVLISENHENPGIQLAEFQPWEFIPVSASFVVTNTSDSGAGSLRKAVADAAPFAGNSNITLTPALAGQSITLASEIIVTTSDAMAIDASALAAGVTIDGGAGTNRILSVNSGTVTLTGLTLTGGNGAGAISNGSGGAIYNQGTLTLNRCTISGNTATATAGRSGGAILNIGLLSINQCTLSGNSCNGFGGAISNYNLASLTHTTVSGNTTTSNGGGIDNGNGTTITLALNNSIIAGNTAGFGSDINNFNGIVSRVGANLVQGYTGIAATGSGTISNAAPLLAPLDNYGGPTKTMALILNSPARNAAAGSAITSDQRGFPIIGTADIGAYEAGTLTNFNAFIWESLPASATVAQHAASFDYDGDGANNLDEYIALTNPGDPASRFRMTNIVRSGSNANLTFTTVLGRNYTVESSTDLVSWAPLVGTFAGTGSPVTVPIGPVTGFTKLFFRARTGP